ncbi:ABC transporter permease [Flaviaesturariibacter flavus]|uniref:ABC transporter permease n=2 Tax=Flaviaesturariibacter flavus TaxID=2502780 RepID=A0A4R1BP32_9BACT|nr:ABC transporter permease [Flaviaesturariibacter flavus]
MALQELWKNKLRTFLSLFGITIGIFCIIGVLSTVQSLEHNLQNEIKSLGSNTIYIDKWDYSAGGGPNYPWWKYVKRPSPRIEELAAVKQRSTLARYTCFEINANDRVQVGDKSLSGVTLYGVTEDFPSIQTMEIRYGRGLSDAEFSSGSGTVVIGNEVADKLFPAPELAVGKLITIRGRKCQVVGVMKKQGKSMIGGWNFDQSAVMPYRFARFIMDERRADPLLLVQAKEGVTTKALADELRVALRAVRRLSPRDEDNFALNDINDFSTSISEAFVAVNIGGWAIAALSLIVGMFGVANIMFVTVKERTSQIGLKKALGAKSGVILSEFLLESAFLCIIGGIIGIGLVYGLTRLVTILFDFPIYVSTSLVLLGLGICVAVGLIAGIIPAARAAKLNPVVAIRS